MKSSVFDEMFARYSPITKEEKHNALGNSKFSCNFAPEKEICITKILGYENRLLFKWRKKKESLLSY
jgi:hypothetical protein